MFTVFYRIGTFSYYVPIVPVLFVFHHHNTYYAMVNILESLGKATDVLLLFAIATMLILCAALGIALFVQIVAIR